MVPAASDGGAVAHDVDAALARLAHFEPEELREVLKRWRLPASDTYDGRVNTLAKALRSGRVPPRAPDSLEAMRRFTDFNLDEQKEFLKRCGLPVGGMQVNVLQRIEDNLGSEGVPIDTAFDYVDELHENGGQHVFLFRLDRAQAAHLANHAEVLERVMELRSVPHSALGDREPVRQRLYVPLSRDAVFFETVVESEEPILAAAYWREEMRPALLGQEVQRTLFIKWVATRRWYQIVQAGGTPRRIDLSERSVSFLHVNLQTGEAELRIQRLHPNPERPLREEYELLRQQIDRLLGVGALQPVLIEPAIRRLLASTRARVVRWEVSWTDSGRLGGGVDPAMVQSLFRRFRNYSAVGLVADWLFEGGATRSVQAKLDALTNEVLFLKRCSVYEMHVVLADIRSGATARLPTPQLEEMAREREEWRPILLQVERSIGGVQGTKEIDLRRMARESWIPEGWAFEVAEGLKTKHPHLFEIRLSASCPATGGRAVDAGGHPVTFGALAGIPETFQCLHLQPKKLEVHPTQGNVDAVLIANPEPPRRSLLDRFQPKVEAWFGMSAARVYTNMLALLLFTVLYVGVVLVTAASFLKLSQLFGGGLGVATALAAPFGLVMLLEAGVVVKLLGGPVTRAAVSALERMTAMFDPRRGPRDLAAWSAKVHGVPKQLRHEKQKDGGPANSKPIEVALRDPGGQAKPEAGLN